MSSPPDIDRAVASFFVGDASFVAACEAIAGALERSDVSCAIVQESGEPIVARASRPLRDVLARAAALANGTRLYMTSREVKMVSLFEDVPPPETAWLVCEPVPDDPGHRAAVVLLGTTLAAPDDLLVALPRVAKACAAIMSRERSDGLAWKLTHTLNNLLAGAIANAEYAASLIEAIDDGTLPSAEERADIIQAIENTRDGVKKMVTTVKSFTSRRP